VTSTAQHAAPHRTAAIEVAMQGLARVTTSERSQLLLNIADMYVAAADNLDEDAVAAFDTIMLGQIDISEHAAVVALSRKLAALANPPPNLIRTFARNADIAIAGPVLSQSPFLATNDLVELAAANGQAHLHALCSRTEIPPALSAVLIERGGPSVHTRLLMTPTAQFEAAEFGRLLSHANADERGRVMVHQRAGIATAPGQPIHECTVMNMSMTGAGILLDAFADLPESFDVILYALEQRQVPCRLIWKADAGLGTAFQHSPFAN
jgi:hypothetical protein